MPISRAPFPRRLTAIDDLTRRDHFHLRAEDECFFFGEYVSGRGYQYSPTNQLLMNLKKAPDRRGLPEWHYKEEAIQQVATAFRLALGDALDRVTFVPVPPSKARDDPLYDDRLTRMLRQIRPLPQLDVRELVVQTTSTVAAHDSDQRPKPEDLEALYRIDDTLVDPTPSTLLVVDDLLTTGAHFRAAQRVLAEVFPHARTIGVFVARRAFPDES